MGGFTEAGGMLMRDLLLHLSSYPEPTPAWAVLAAISVADSWGARLSVALGHVHVPRVSNFLADLLVDANKVIAAENAKSDRQAKALLETFDSEIDPDRRGDEILIECGWTATPRELVGRARRYDLTILPKYGQADLNPIAEGLIFESGRPVLLLPERGGAGHRFAAITIGWDGSRAAARALGDSLSLCRQAKSVELVAVIDEKELPADPGLTDIRRHLAAHDVDASLVELPAQRLDAGSALLRHCADAGTDLLVMGAYGHTRLREFVLGGATRSVLAQAEMPVLLSH